MPTPLWKMMEWVRHLGWLFHSRWEVIQNSMVPVTTNQIFTIIHHYIIIRLSGWDPIDDPRFDPFCTKHFGSTKRCTPRSQFGRSLLPCNKNVMFGVLFLNKHLPWYIYIYINLPIKRSVKTKTVTDFKSFVPIPGWHIYTPLKNISQLGWWHSQYDGKFIQNSMVPVTNQINYIFSRSLTVKPGYPLVNVYITMENHHFWWEIPLFLWPFSIAILT